jgi:hypothetical protein
VPIAIETATGAGSKAKRRTDMATIGTFKKTGNELGCVLGSVL